MRHRAQLCTTQIVVVDHGLHGADSVGVSTEVDLWFLLTSRSP